MAGSIVKDNTQVLCKDCNARKAWLSIDYRTKTFIVEPVLMSLSPEDLRKILARPARYAGTIFGWEPNRATFTLAEVWEP